MKKNDRIKRWEMALALSLCITLCHSFALGGTGIAWWGVIFPGLTGGETAETVEAAKLDGPAGGDGIEIRFRLLDWLEEIGLIN